MWSLRTRENTLKRDPSDANKLKDLLELIGRRASYVYPWESKVFRVGARLDGCRAGSKKGLGWAPGNWREGAAMLPKQEIEKQIDRLIQVIKKLQVKAENTPDWFEAIRISQTIAEETYRLEKMFKKISFTQAP